MMCDWNVIVLRQKVPKRSAGIYVCKTEARSGFCVALLPSMCFDNSRIFELIYHALTGVHHLLHYCEYEGASRENGLCQKDAFCRIFRKKEARHLYPKTGEFVKDSTDTINSRSSAPDLHTLIYWTAPSFYSPCLQLLLFDANKALCQIWKNNNWYNSYDIFSKMLVFSATWRIVCVWFDERVKQKNKFTTELKQHFIVCRKRA